MELLNKLKTEFLPSLGLNTDRKLYLDFLKLLAAFLTVFYHFAYYKLNYGFSTEELYLPNFNRIFMCFCSCCVPLFFMVNGSLLLNKQRNFKQVYLKALKLLFLIIFWNFLNFPSWFFKTLIILYIAFPLLQLIYRKKTLLCITCATVFIMPFMYNAVILIAKLIAPEFSFSLLGFSFSVKDLPVTGVFTMYSILYFLLGAVLSKKENLKTSVGITSALVGLALVVAECTVYTNIHNTMYDGVNAAFPTLGALLLATGIFITVKNMNFNKTGKILSLFSTGILPIYLTHIFLIQYSLKLTDAFNIPMNFIYFFLGTALIIVITALISKLTTRIPIICWLFKI